MRKSVRSLFLTACATLLAGCETSGPAYGGSIGSFSFEGSSPPMSYGVPIADSEWVIAPVELPSGAAASSVFGKTSGSGSYSRSMLPSTSGFYSLGSGPWINFALFNRSTGESVLGFDRRIVVWQVVWAVAQRDAILLLATDTDTNGDAKINDADATAIFHYRLADRTITRLTPPRSTVVRTTLDEPRKNEDQPARAKPATLPSADAMFVTVRMDRDGDGKFEDDEPLQVLRVDATMKSPPQSVLSEPQWEKAWELWKK